MYYLDLQYLLICNDKVIVVCIKLVFFLEDLYLVKYIYSNYICKEFIFNWEVRFIFLYFEFYYELSMYKFDLSIFLIEVFCILELCRLIEQIVGLYFLYFLFRIQRFYWSS